MSNSQELAGAISMVALLFAIFIIVWHFWVFPCLIGVLQGIHWVSVTESFSNALYWLSIGIWLLLSVRVKSAK